MLTVAGLGPAAELGGLDGHLSPAKIANFDLRKRDSDAKVSFGC